MTQPGIGGPQIKPEVLDLLQHERGQALSLREWKFRLAGHGYAIKDVMGRQVVTTLPHGVVLGVLPAQTV